MAIRGRKPTATIIKLTTGNPGKRPISESEPPTIGRPSKPPRLKGRANKLWDEILPKAPWLGAADAYKLHIWCALQAEFEKSPGKMPAARIGQLRSTGSELGLDPGSRARLGVLGVKGDDGKTEDNKAAKYFSS